MFTGDEWKQYWLSLSYFHSGLLIFYGIACTNPLGALGSLLGFAAAFVTSATLWCTRADDNSRKFWKWLIQGSAVAPATWLGHHLATNACSAKNNSHSVWVMAFGNAPMIVCMSAIWWVSYSTLFPRDRTSRWLAAVLRARAPAALRLAARFFLATAFTNSQIH